MSAATSGDLEIRGPTIVLLVSGALSTLTIIVASSGGALPEVVSVEI